MTSDQAASPFADIRRLLTEMPGPDGDAVAAIRARDALLTKPPGSLGRLEEFVEWLGAWQGKAKPTLDRPMVCVFAGSHGVVERGVSAFPAAVNRQMLDNFAAGGAAINQLCAAYGLGFRVFDLAVDLPTGDICSGPALDEKGCVATMAFGMEAVAAGTDCLAVGEMGIGNTTVAAAIYAALYGGEAEHWVGRGTGLDAAGLARKAQAVRLALETHKDHLGDPLAALGWITNPPRAREQQIPDHWQREHIVAAFSAATGYCVDPVELNWWTVFSCWKLSVIVLTGVEAFVTGKMDRIYHNPVWLFQQMFSMMKD